MRRPSDGEVIWVSDCADSLWLKHRHLLFSGGCIQKENGQSSGEKYAMVLFSKRENKGGLCTVPENGKRSFCMIESKERGIVDEQENIENGDLSLANPAEDKEKTEKSDGMKRYSNEVRYSDLTTGYREAERGYTDDWDEAVRGHYASILMDENKKHGGWIIYDHSEKRCYDVDGNEVFVPKADRDLNEYIEFMSEHFAKVTELALLLGGGGVEDDPFQRMIELVDAGKSVEEIREFVKCKLDEKFQNLLP